MESPALACMSFLPDNRTWRAPDGVAVTRFQPIGGVPPSPMLAGVPALPARCAKRGLAAGMSAVLLTLGAVGCNSFDATFGQQEAVVQFRSQTPDAVRLQVRSACSHVPSARPEPIPTDQQASNIPYEVRYQVGGASDADLARLQQCLQRFPAVVGIEFSGPAGS